MEKTKLLWKNYNSHFVGILGKSKIDKNTKVASFDLDSTLIEPTGKKKFSTGSDDWKFYDSAVIPKLDDLYKKNYQIVIVSNQRGMSSGKTDKDTWKKKVENVVSEINIPLTILVSFKDDCYRKPMTKLWDSYISCDIKNSFFCGDAGGLPKRKINNKIIPKDFSDSDYKFALNLGLKFIHRDEFIYGTKWAPNLSLKYIDFDKIDKGSYDDFEPNHPELIINVGYPASGKSYYTKNYVTKHNYEYINQDTLKTAKKCLGECDKLLKKGHSVVIDNTNPSIEVRKKYIDIAKKYHVKCRAILFTTSYDLAMHNNQYRNWITDGSINKIPKIAYNIFKSKYEKPTKNEGFYQIDEIEFKLDPNADKSYFMYF